MYNQRQDKLSMLNKYYHYISYRFYDCVLFKNIVYNQKLMNKERRADQKLKNQLDVQLKRLENCSFDKLY